MIHQALGTLDIGLPLDHAQIFTFIVSLTSTFPTNFADVKDADAELSVRNDPLAWAPAMAGAKVPFDSVMALS